MTMRWPRHWSLRVRLTAGAVAWIALALVITGVALSSLFRDHVQRTLLVDMEHHLDQLVAAVDFTDPQALGFSSKLNDPRFQRPYSGLYWQIDGLNPDQSGLLRSRSLWDTVIAPPTLIDRGPREKMAELRAGTVAGPDGQQLLTVERIVRPGGQTDRLFRVLVANDRQSLRQPTLAFTGTLTVALLILAVGLVSAVVFQVAAGLAPLSRLRHALAAVQHGRAGQVEGTFPTEIQPLVDDLNALLVHDAEVVARARTQAGNLAHALKTPLSVMANGAAKSKTPLARLVSEQVLVARRQVDYHLARARAAAAVEVPGMRVELAPVIAALCRAMEHIHAERQLRLAVTADQPLAFRGEVQDLQEMLGNLLDNACKWAATRVTLTVIEDDGQLWLTIDDDGPGLPPERRQEVFARGQRADETVSGSGLGLAIVRDLAELYGGGVTLQDSPLGGLQAVLRLPAAPISENAELLS